LAGIFPQGVIEELSDSLVELRFSDRWADDCIELIRKDTDRISLHHRRIESIDLKQAANLEKLEIIQLTENSLTSIDLRPLSKCKHLKSLDLSYNKLESLDLYPLLHCIDLENLNLEGNPLINLDTSPLYFCRRLKHVGLPPMKQRDGGLMNGEGHGHLGRITASVYNFHRSLGIPPWTFLKKPKPPSLERLIGTMGRQGVWRLLIEALEALGAIDRYSLTNCMLQDLGMEELAAFDGDPERIVELIPIDELSEQEEYSLVYGGVIELLRESLEQGRSTLFLDIDKLSTTAGSILIPLILKKREEEMEEIMLSKRKGRISLRPLWMTAYGYEVLKALRMGHYTNETGFEKIRRSIDKLGFKIRLMDQSTKMHLPPDVFTSKFSQGLKRRVFESK
jgi:hypothetical protein